jgi:allantoin racemase
MRIAGIIAFDKRTKASEMFKSYIQNTEDLEILYTGTIVPSETASDIADLSNTLAAIKKAEQDGFDAVVLFPHLDIGCEEARELVRIPVLSAIRTALHIGLILGGKIGILTRNKPNRRAIEFKVRAYGLENMVVYKELGVTAHENKAAWENWVKTGQHGDVLDNFVSVAIKAIEEDDAQVLTHSSGSMSWLVEPATKRLREKGYDIPFIDPVPMMVETARALVKLGLSHSKLSYPGFKWVSGSAEYAKNMPH